VTKEARGVVYSEHWITSSSSTSLSVPSPLRTLLLFPAAELFPSNHRLSFSPLFTAFLCTTKAFSSFSTLLPVFTILLTVANVLKNLLDAPIPHKSSLSFSLSELFFSGVTQKLKKSFSQRTVSPSCLTRKTLEFSLFLLCLSLVSLASHTLYTNYRNKQNQLH
jgi:hypothetical protein